MVVTQVGVEAVVEVIGGTVVSVEVTHGLKTRTEEHCGGNVSPGSGESEREGGQMEEEGLDESQAQAGRERRAREHSDSHVVNSDRKGSKEQAEKEEWVTRTGRTGRPGVRRVGKVTQRRGGGLELKA